MSYRVLVINPGSTSTKVAVYEDEVPLFSEAVRHSADELARFRRVSDQYPARRGAIFACLEERGINLPSLAAVVGRGGVLHPLASGTYVIDDKVLADLADPAIVDHASNLGPPLAHEVARRANVPAFTVDPVAVDELDEVARISGLPEISRRSLSHALNIKAVARRAATDLGRPYEALNLVITHLGGGISVTAHRQGRMVDVNNAAEAGPFAPERSGSLPLLAFVDLCFSGRYSVDGLKRLVLGAGGLVAHLGTNSTLEVEQRIADGDEKARLVYEALAYNVAKEIGAMATVLHGQVDAILLTGGVANSEMLVAWIRERVQFIAPVLLYPGEDEMLALAQGALRVLGGRRRRNSTVVRSFADILKVARDLGPKTVAIAAADEVETMEAALQAREMAIAEPILIGSRQRMEKIAAEESWSLDGVRVVDEPDPAQAARVAVQLARTGEADAVAKGRMDIAVLIRAALDRETGLRAGRLFSHISAFEIPGFERLIFVTDAGVVVEPTLEQKAQIVQNAIDLAHNLGIERPLVAILAALEMVNPKMPSTTDAANLAKMADRGQIKGGIVDGPLALDNAISLQSAAVKGINSPVAGRADILVAPDVESGNVLAKGITYFAHGKMAAVVVGAKCPIAAVARADPSENKLASIGLAVLLAHRS